MRVSARAIRSSPRRGCDLEGELGGPLLYRSPKGITLTAEGGLLLRTANRIHRDLREAIWEISETQELRRGRLSIARVRGQRLYRESGWVCLKADHQPRPITEVLRVFDEMKSEFGGRPPGR